MQHDPSLTVGGMDSSRATRPAYPPERDRVVNLGGGVGYHPGG